MFKQLITISLTLALVACSSAQQNWQKDESKETIYQKTNNHSQLTQLYKNQLQEHESDSVREKLSSSYLAMGDAESALFYVTPLTQQKKASIKSLLIEAKAYGELGQYSAAIASARRVLNKDAEHAEAENLLGTYYGYSYQFGLAKGYFERARQHFYDSITVNNNLAVLDIAQGNYQSAMQRLLPLYQRGQVNQKVMANLTLSMAKLGHYQFVEEVLSERYSKHQIDHIYRSLRSHQPYSAESRSLALTGTQVSESDHEI